MNQVTKTVLLAASCLMSSPSFACMGLFAETYILQPGPPKAVPRGTKLLKVASRPRDLKSDSSWYKGIKVRVLEGLPGTGWVWIAASNWSSCTHWSRASRLSSLPTDAQATYVVGYLYQAKNGTISIDSFEFGPGGERRPEKKFPSSLDYFRVLHQRLRSGLQTEAFQKKLVRPAKLPNDR